MLVHPLPGRLVAVSCFKGVYHLYKDETYLYQTGKGHTIQEVRIVKGLNNPDLDAAVGEDLVKQFRQELELVQGASHEFDHDAFLSGDLTPVFFSSHHFTGVGFTWHWRRCPLNQAIQHMVDTKVPQRGTEAQHR